MDRLELFLVRKGLRGVWFRVLSLPLIHSSPTRLPLLPFSLTTLTLTLSSPPLSLSDQLLGDLIRQQG